jgi:hypothetical protein
VVLEEDETDLLARSPGLAACAIWKYDDVLQRGSEPHDWVWAGCVERGNVVLLCGEPGGGKTSLVFLIAAAVSAREGYSGAWDGRLLGREVTPMREGQYIVIVEAEQSERSSCRKLLAAYQTLGLPGRETHRTLLIARRSVRLGDLIWQEVAQLIAEGRVGHVILDTIARVCPGESNDERAQTEIFDSIVRTMAGSRQPPTCWLLTHSRKGERTGSVADVSGSQARAGQADTVALLQGHQEDGAMACATLSWPKIRDADEPALPYTYRLRRGILEECAPPAPAEAAAAGPRKAARDSRVDEVIEFVASHRLCSANEVHRGLGGNRNAVLELVRTLISEGRLCRYEHGELTVPVTR